MRIFQKTCLVLVLFGLALSSLLVPATNQNASLMPSDIHRMITNDNQSANIASESIHSQSISSFAETIPDDILCFPDQFFEPTKYYSNDGVATPHSTNDHTFTHQKDGDFFKVIGCSVVSELNIYLNFTLPKGNQIDGLQISSFGGVNGSSSFDMYVFDFGAGEWYNYATGYGISWANQTIYKSGLWNGSDIWFRVHSSFQENESLLLDYFTISVYIMTGSDKGYSESCTDLSDWNERLDLNSLVTSLDTDGDVMDFHAVTYSDNDLEGVYSTGISLVGFDYYLEFRYRFTSILSINFVQLTLYSDDNVTSSPSLSYRDCAPQLSWKTAKVYVPSLSNTTITGIEAIGIEVGGNVSANTHFYCDYIRIDRGDEMGWQHDGSTTAGIVKEPKDGWAYSISSDSDRLNITMQRNGGTSGYGSVWFTFDTTETEADLDVDSYQFAEVSFEITRDTDLYWIFNPYVGGNTTGNVNQAIGFYWGKQPTTIARSNLLALNKSAGTQSGIRIIWYCSSPTGVSTLLIDYIKIYSILDFTISQSDIGAHDVLYEESSYLRCSSAGGEFILDHDPVLSVDSLLHSYMMIDRDNLSETAYFIDSWSLWSSNQTHIMDDGIVKDVKIRLNQSGTIRSLKFILFPNLPVIRFVAVVPHNPSDSSEVVIFCGVSGEQIESVTLDALTFPNDFIDIPYHLAETDLDVWSYTFNSIPSGDYFFEVIVTSRDVSVSSFVTFSVVPSVNQDDSDSINWIVAMSSALGLVLAPLLIIGYEWFYKKSKHMGDVLEGADAEG